MKEIKRDCTRFGLERVYLEVELNEQVSADAIMQQYNPSMKFTQMEWHQMINETGDKRILQFFWKP